MKTLSTATLFSLLLTALPAAAQEYIGMAKPWQLGFQPPASPVMEKLYAMHDFLLIIIIGITLFVLALMGYICVRFSRKNNPVPSTTTHNTMLEIVWTVIPIIILVAIAIPSLRIHYFMEVDKKPDMTLKVTGYQWYWHYDYPDYGNFGFDSYIKKDKDLQPGDIRMLAVDNPVVVPVNTNVRVLMTGADVIHSWSVPAFGVKRDAVPGRLNESWFSANKIGTFYGQCSQLCGVGHGFMPIVVKVVSKDDFDSWVAGQEKTAGVSTAPTDKGGDKTGTPLTQPVSAEHKNPTPVINQEKASGTQPAPAKAAGDAPRSPADNKPVAATPHTAPADKTAPGPDNSQSASPSDTDTQEEQ